MREQKFHLYMDSDERRILIESLVELKNQLIRQGRYTDCVDEIIITFGLHASITLSNETLAACREAMGDADAGFHVHVAEGPADERDSEERYGRRILERFRDFGLLGPKSIAVHCIHIDEHEMDILKETDTEPINRSS